MSTPNLPNVREPFIDARSGQISRPWWIFLQQLMAKIGDDTDLGAIEEALRLAIRDILDLQRQELAAEFGQVMAALQGAIEQVRAAEAGAAHAHGRWADPDMHALATTTSAGFMSPSDKTAVNSSVPSTRQVIAGAGLTGGGTLAANRTFNVGANPDGSIVVNADDIQVGILATDTQHGNRGGGALHAVATTTAAGFMSAADKAALNAAVPNTRQVIAGSGLTGGGTLSADRTLNVVAADGSIVVNPDSIQVGVLQSDSQHGNRGGGPLHAVATRTVPGFMSAADKTKLDYLSSTNFYVSQNVTPQSIAASTFTALNFDTKNFDDNNEFDIAADTFVPLITGYYTFNGSVYGTQGATANRALDLFVNGVSVRRLAQRNDVGANALGGSSGPVLINAGDVVTLRYFTSVADITSNQANATFLSGWRVK